MREHRGVAARESSISSPHDRLESRGVLDHALRRHSSTASATARQNGCAL